MPSYSFRQIKHRQWVGFYVLSSVSCSQQYTVAYNLYSCQSFSVAKATLDGLSVGWTQDGPDYGFYATVSCCEQDPLDKT